MDYTMFAAIEVGSSEMSMKIYELSKKSGIKEIDYIRSQIEIGAETYSTHRISHVLINDMCDVLSGFLRVMHSYNVTAYRAIVTSAIREAANSVMVLDRIKITTGIQVDVLNNSEKRFLYYKAISFRDDLFKKAIKETTTIVDVGAGSIQISLYNQDALISTQNIRLGFLRVLEAITDFQNLPESHNRLISEYINNDLNTYKELYLDNVNLVNIIAVGDNINELTRYLHQSGKVKGVKNNYYIDREEFEEIYKKFLNTGRDVIAKELGITREQVILIIPTVIIYKKMFEVTNATKMWIPNVQINDGIVVDYCEKTTNLVKTHDFTSDIILAARNLAKKYKSDTSHTRQVEYVALKLFDSMKNYHGMGKRERLITQLAAILHNCGAFINMNEVPVNSYNIIMSTEIIGLSHQEREMVANLIKYITYDLPKFSDMNGNLDMNNYIIVSKITAMLRLANAMDKSHMQKFRHVEVKVVDNTMVVEASSLADITLEKGLFKKKSDFFEEVYGIKPKLKHVKNSSFNKKQDKDRNRV